MQEGKLNCPAWGSISPKAFFSDRMGRDIVFAYYAHPTVMERDRLGRSRQVRVDMCEWDTIGAILGSRRGEATATWKTRFAGTGMSADDPQQRPRAKHGRAPDVFRLGGWMPMRRIRRERGG